MPSICRNESSEPEPMFRVLDIIGVSEECRKLYLQMATTLEELEKDVNEIESDKYKTVIHIVGSQFEGTTTYGLQSDIDFLHAFPETCCPVIEHIDEAPPNGTCLLILTDCDCKPGYVKLQQVLHRIPQTMQNSISNGEPVDDKGRVLFKHIQLGQLGEQHGPALRYSSLLSGLAQDHVYAFRRLTIPRFANEWLKRARPYGWPSPALLRKMGSYGCFFVGVGHPKSETYDTEWRVSFTLQERELMLSLNETQHKCYVLLKIIKKEIIQKTVGDSITSYHCKTCLFHLIERSRKSIWIPSNFLSLLESCLNLLLYFVTKGRCPNYFIPEENMFYKLDKNILQRVQAVIRSILEDQAEMLLNLESDYLGKLFTNSCVDQNSVEGFVVIKHFMVLQCYARFYSYFQRKKYFLHGHVDRSSRESNILQIDDILQRIKQTGCLQNEHDRNRKPNRLKKYLNLIREKTKASIEMEKGEESNFDQIIDNLTNEALISEDSDHLYSQLIVATLYLHTGRLEECQNILLNCEAFLKPYLISICACYSMKYFLNRDLLDKSANESLSFGAFRRECVSGCLLFSSNQTNLVHQVLQYEMSRSADVSTKFLDADYQYWFQWTVVDSKAYLYLLQYLLYSRKAKPDYKNAVIDKLSHIINTDRDLGHRETACNILGWVYEQEGRYQEAFKYFLRSWRIRPRYNAAKWHVLIMVHSLLN